MGERKDAFMAKTLHLTVATRTRDALIMTLLRAGDVSTVRLHFASTLHKATNHVAP